MGTSGRDAIAELRAHDPAGRVRLDAVDPGALRALREGITMTDRRTDPVAERRTGAPGRRPRRTSRRGVAALGLGVALVGTGVAYAASQLWTDAETTATNPMVIDCQEVFGQADGAVAGRTLTGDPVADCATARADADLAPLVDPVAFLVDGALFVTPRDQVPDGADVLDVDVAEAARIRELQASLGDPVDGGWARCLPAGDAVAWATAELDRLGLAAWSVEVVHGSDDEGRFPCSMLMAGDEPQTVQVYPGQQPRYDDAGPDPDLEALRGIGAACLTVDEALAVAEATLADEEGATTVRVLDASASCARVDLEGGGSTVVTVYGPTTADG